MQDKRSDGVDMDVVDATWTRSTLHADVLAVYGARLVPIWIRPEADGAWEQITEQVIVMVDCT
jgi:hypothetical protein